MLNRETAIEVRKSAMNGYALLITADVNGYFWSDSDTVLPVLALIDQCLDHENLDVKIAGGEFMALIAEAESLHKVRIHTCSLRDYFLICHCRRSMNINGNCCRTKWMPSRNWGWPKV